MISKECLEKLFSIPKYCNQCPYNAECNFPNTSCDKLYETIKQDLEVLEWLKEHIDICISDFNWISLRELLELLINDYKDTEYIKEWLEND